MKNNKTNQIFKKIENVRSKNNKNWMNILRIAYDSKPKETVAVLNRILSSDQKLIRLARNLSKKIKK